MIGRHERQPRHQSDKTVPIEPQECGQGLLEFALVAVILVVVLFGIIDFARLFFAYATMAQGAREGARYGITHAPYNSADPNDVHTQEIIEAAEAMMVVIGGDATVIVSYPGGDDPSNPKYPPGCTRSHHCRVQVQITGTLEVWTPLIPEVNLVAQSTMHFE